MGKVARITVTIFLFFTLFTFGCIASSHDSEKEIHSITDPYEFSIAEWEFNSLTHEMWESLKPAHGAQIDDAEIVKQYFASIHTDETKRTELEDEAEKILSLQIREALLVEGIANPLDAYLPLKAVFPPVNFEFESPPCLLIVSPRHEIKLLRRTTLKPDIIMENRESIESEVDALGYSSLVARLGGVGFTYPTMVYQTSDIRRALDVAVEEWFHQYLALQPLGFAYVLDITGLRSDYDIIIMNETVAGIVSKEIGGKVYRKYYAEDEEAILSKDENNSEFEKLMSEIRIEVDGYLDEGQVTEAEEYMNEMRDFLESKGYYIRKLNQAYFAFHGTYADDPETAIRIGRDLQDLRDRCSSLREFLNKVTVMTDQEDIRNTLEETGE